jgi:hypothetical protein
MVSRCHIAELFASKCQLELDVQTLLLHRRTHSSNSTTLCHYCLRSKDERCLNTLLLVPFLIQTYAHCHDDSDVDSLSACHHICLLISQDLPGIEAFAVYSCDWLIVGLIGDIGVGIEKIAFHEK